MFVKRVNFAVLLYDDFTGEIIIGGAHLFKVNGRMVRPIAKSVGFYVFMDMEEEEFTVEISGGKYQKETIIINTKELSSTSPVVSLRLYRRYQAGFNDCEYIEGTNVPGRVVYALKQGKGPMKLVSFKNAGDDTAVVLSGYFYKPALHIRFAIGTESDMELFITKELLPDKSYLLTKGFDKQRKSGEPVRRAYSARCDEEGKYYIPVEKGESALIDRVIFLEEEGEKWGYSYVTEPR